MKWSYMWKALLGQLSLNDAMIIGKHSEYRLFFGKHKGNTLDEIWNHDPTYLAWFLRQKDTMCKQSQIRVKQYVEIKTKLTEQRFEVVKG